MPNWALNELHVSGSAEDVKAFIEANTTDGVFKFATLVPEPRYDNDTDWYDWRIENWGTKWDLEDGDVGINFHSAGAVITFQTAWAYPLEWLNFVANKFRNLYFYHYSADPSMDWHVELDCEPEFTEGKRNMVESKRGPFLENARFWGLEDMFEEDEELVGA
jgi:hypothetical protein